MRERASEREMLKAVDTGHRFSLSPRTPASCGGQDKGWAMEGEQVREERRNGCGRAHERGVFVCVKGGEACHFSDFQILFSLFGMKTPQTRLKPLSYDSIRRGNSYFLFS